MGVNSMSKLTIEVNEGLGWITLDAPNRHNALTAQMWLDLPTAVARLEQDETVRVLILRGAGTKAFSAGADISEFDTLRQGDAAKAYNASNTEAFYALRNCRKPVLSMINGYCLGGGMLLALSTDLMVSSESALFSLPPARLGLGFDIRWMGVILETMPAHLAKEMLFTGGRFQAAHLGAFGVLNHIHPDDKLEAQTITLAKTIAGNAPLSLLSLKAAINDLCQNNARVEYEIHDALTEACFQSADYKEGRRAFAEKRSPVFKGE